MSRWLGLRLLGFACALAFDGWRVCFRAVRLGRLRVIGKKAFDSLNHYAVMQQVHDANVKAEAQRVSEIKGEVYTDGLSQRLAHGGKGKKTQIDLS